MRLIRFLPFVCGLTLCACAARGDDPGVGSVSLPLTSEANGVTYRLSGARFSLTGPETKGFSGGSDASVSLELAPGAYQLELLEGWRLVDAHDPDAGSVPARLVSANPTPILVQAHDMTQALFRFELADGTALAGGKGKLHVGFSLAPPGEADAAVPRSACVSGLRIDEVDYDQVGNDTAEFIEIVNAADCDAALDGVTLELVNGGDGTAYAHYPLHAAGAVLPRGGRLLIADAAVLSMRTPDVLGMALNASGLQNGPDGVRLVSGANVLDAFAYEGDVPGLAEGHGTGADDAEKAFGRCPDGFDSDQNALDFKLLAPTPGAANQCP